MLFLHRSERADALLAALASVLGAPLADPVAPEVISVPTRGVERWIAQRLSDRLGVTANVSFPSPAGLASVAMSAVSGIDPFDDPWAPERSLWPLIETIDAHMDDPRLAPLAGHLRAASPEGEKPRRLATARHLVQLFDRYGLERPDMVLEWASGDGEYGGWQGLLWRLLRQRIATPSVPERLVQTLSALGRPDEPDLDLPERVSVFGLTRIAATHLRLLCALAARRDVHLLVLHPSAALWERVRHLLPQPPPPPGVLRRSDDPTGRAARHPLLRSWGTDARELQTSLASAEPFDDSYHPGLGDREDTLLQRLQLSIASDDQALEPVPLAEGDRSVQIHSCHGRSRQVEVLRDALLHILAADPTIEPRDVIVMCPDIEEFAPVFKAVLVDAGTGALRVRLADRSVRRTNPLLAVAAELLDLASGRAGAPEVLDFMSRSAVSRRFDLSPSDLAVIEAWVEASGVRWGFDAGWRHRWGLGSVPERTWRAGLDRLLLGVAMTDDASSTFAGAAPLEWVPSNTIDLAGRAALIIGLLEQALGSLARPMAPHRWAETLLAATSSLAAHGPGEEWQQSELQEILDSVAGEAGGTKAEISLDEACELLRDRLAGRPTTANFRTGDLTVCTLYPMRSVPHRVVAIVGLDDGAYPRNAGFDGDDMLAADPHVGDRRPAAEDRQLLLDALMAATDHLIVTYSGKDERTNKRLPPCVPVAELVDVLAAGVEGDLEGRVVFDHPLHGYDPRNFEAGGVGGIPGPWSHDAVALSGAEASRRPAVAPDRFTTPLPALVEPVVDLADVVAFLRHPARSFLRRRLSLHLGEWDEELTDRMDPEASYLEQWEVGEALIRSRRAGMSAQAAATAELGRNRLPPGRLGRAVLDMVSAGVDPLVDALERRGYLGAGESVEVAVPLPDGTLLAGSVPSVCSKAVVHCSYSKLKASTRLVSWVQLLALCAAAPDRAQRAVTVGRASRGPVRVSTVEAVDSTTAIDLLLPLVALYRAGMCEPLPLASATAAAWAEAGPDRDERVTAASRVWDGDGGERDDPEHVFLYGRGSAITALLDPLPTPAEEGPGWSAERSRFGRLAERLWMPLLEAERSETS